MAAEKTRDWFIGNHRVPLSLALVHHRPRTRSYPRHRRASWPSLLEQSFCSSFCSPRHLIWIVTPPASALSAILYFLFFFLFLYLHLFGLGSAHFLLALQPSMRPKRPAIFIPRELITAITLIGLGKVHFIHVITCPPLFLHRIVNLVQQKKFYTWKKSW